MAAESGTDPIDVVVFAGPRHVPDLLGLTLRLAAQHLPWGSVTIVTPNAQVRDVTRVARAAGAWPAAVVADEDVAPGARDLPAWFRQQYLKLHADVLVDSSCFVCLGADTLVLDPIKRSELFCDREPICRYFPLGADSQHLWFEMARLLHLATRLGVRPTRTLPLGSLVCDLFPMAADHLIEVREFVSGRLAGGLSHWLASLGSRHGADYRFGEWTLYWLVQLDGLGRAPTLRDGLTERWFDQVHSLRDFRRPDMFTTKVIHLAWPEVDVGDVLAVLKGACRLPSFKD